MPTSKAMHFSVIMCVRGGGGEGDSVFQDIQLTPMIYHNPSVKTPFERKIGDVMRTLHYVTSMLIFVTGKKSTDLLWPMPIG